MVNENNEYYRRDFLKEYNKYYSEWFLNSEWFLKELKTKKIYKNKETFIPNELFEI